MTHEILGSLEFQLLAVLLEHPRDAFAVAIWKRVTERTGRERTFAAIHAALNRLRDKGMISCWWGEPTRNGRRKRLYRIEARGIEAVRQVQRSVQVEAVLPGGAEA